jgi:hypothetical protein
MGWRDILRLSAIALLFGGCATVPLAAPNAPLSENQAVDLMEHPDRWLGRTITVRIYPYDNGHTESYVACLEACDAASADRSTFLIYTRTNRFKGYSGKRAEVVTAVFGKICPDTMPLCLDAPARIFALNEVS